MPPSFPIFLGLIVYLAFLALALVIFTPMLFFQHKRLIAKKILATVLISFPCLVVTGLIFSIIFILPVLMFSWLANNGYIPRIPGIILTIIGLIVFVGCIAVTALYLWYFTSKMIYYRLERKPIADFLNSDKVFKILRAYLTKFNIHHSSS